VTTEQAVLASAYAIMAGLGLAAASIDAIARHSKVSKMTVYKWWPSREALLIDAFLHQARTILPLGSEGTALERIRDHAMRYVEALAGDFGKVQLAVVSECIANTGSAAIFSERYLAQRREAIASAIAAGRADGSVAATDPPHDLYDRIYGTLFYRYLFGFGALSRDHARDLVVSVLTSTRS